MSATRKDVRRYYEKWFSVLEKICEIESPWCYLCIAALIDYLATATYPGIRQGKRYQYFITEYFPAKYRKFRYENGKQELPQQMYYILRCGLVHSFSLFPDPERPDRGRGRSIVLNHRSNAGGARHLSPYSDPRAKDAARFVAEDFLADTKKAAYELLRQAKPGSELEKAILDHFTDQPPIEWRE